MTFVWVYLWDFVFVGAGAPVTLPPLGDKTVKLILS